MQPPWEGALVLCNEVGPFPPPPNSGICPPTFLVPFQGWCQSARSPWTSCSERGLDMRWSLWWAGPQSPWTATRASSGCIFQAGEASCGWRCSTGEGLLAASAGVRDGVLEWADWGHILGDPQLLHLLEEEVSSPG